jgi:hypothetical protein
MPTHVTTYMPSEGMQLQISISSVLTTIGECTKIKPPGGKVTPVPTTVLASTSKTFRPGKIPELGEITASVFHDNNDPVHQLLQSRITAPGPVDSWKIIFVDGSATTPSNSTFQGFVTGYEFDDSEDESNVAATLTVQITGNVTNTAGV